MKKTFPYVFWLIIFALSIKTADVESTCYFALDNGYRWDRISNRVTIGGLNTGVHGSTQKLRDINSYQLGGRGFCNFSPCSFVRAQGHYGWTGGGKYSEGGFFGNTKGHTYDVKGALGYYFYAAPCIWIAPVAGYSLDVLNLKAEDIHVTINCQTFHLSDIRVHQRFKGPFVGFDLAIEINHCLDFYFGYEFHFSRWRGERFLHREYGNPPLFGTTTAFSNIRHLNHAYGNVFTFDLGYQFCNCWRLGLDLNYQVYYGDFGKYRQTKGQSNALNTYANVDGLWWLSFASTITLGRAF